MYLRRQVGDTFVKLADYSGFDHHPQTGPRRICNLQVNRYARTLGSFVAYKPRRRTRRRMGSVRPRTRSRPHVLPRWIAKAKAQGDSSAGGNVASSRRQFGSSYSTISGYGRYLLAEAVNPSETSRLGN